MAGIMSLMLCTKNELATRATENDGKNVLCFARFLGFSPALFGMPPDKTKPGLTVGLCHALMHSYNNCAETW